MFYTLTPDGRRWAYAHGVWSLITASPGDPVPCIEAERSSDQQHPVENAVDARRYRWLREHGCVWADRAFPHFGDYGNDATCTGGKVGDVYADSFVDYAMLRSRSNCKGTGE